MMTDGSTDRAAKATFAQSGKNRLAPDTSKEQSIIFVLVPAIAFCLYLLSSLQLQQNGANGFFGADSNLYITLAKGQVYDRVVRFHPVTVYLSLAWMKIVSPLTLWIAPHYLLKALFAGIGAIGVWAAQIAFAAAVPRRYIIVSSIIYATSFGVWYFASIEESKIVSATLASLYIAIYFRLRENWTMPSAVICTAVLFVACLNEIVSIFLVIIPVVDTLIRRGRNWRNYKWVAIQALTGAIVLIILELVINVRPVAPMSDQESATHFGLLIHYLTDNNYDLASLYWFIINWLFFNIAAPTAHAFHSVPIWPDSRGFFEPALANYLYSPGSAFLAIIFCLSIAAIATPCWRAPIAKSLSGILPALIAYTAVRGVFFFIFDPPEALLFSPAVTLAHIMLVVIPFSVSRLPKKRTLLMAAALMLLIINGSFMLKASSDYPPGASEFTPMTYVHSSTALSALSMAVGTLRECKEDLRFAQQLKYKDKNRHMVASIKCDRFPDRAGNLKPAAVHVTFGMGPNGNLTGAVSFRYEIPLR